MVRILQGFSCPMVRPCNQTDRLIHDLSVYLGDKVVVLTGWRVFVRAHSRSIRIHPACRNASAEAAID